MPHQLGVMKIALVGPPGSGKGSQCVRIKEQYPELCYINPHMMLRDEIHRQTPRGVAAQAKMLNGEVIASDTYMALLLERARSSACKAGYILDGMPTDVRQAETLVGNGEELDAVLFLAMTDDNVLRRTSGRWVHQRSGRIYHDHFARPKQPGVDDETGEKLVQRHDDTTVIARQRLDTYTRNRAALETYLRTTEGDVKARLAEQKKAAAAAKSQEQQQQKKKEQQAASPPPPPPATPPPAAADATTGSSSSNGSGAKASSPSTQATGATVDPAEPPVDELYIPYVFAKTAPYVAEVDANGTLDVVRKRVFTAIDAAIEAKKERARLNRWWRWIKFW